MIQMTAMSSQLEGECITLERLTIERKIMSARHVTRGVTATLLAVCLSAGGATAAQADTRVVGCVGMLAGQCVSGTMGAKNFTNHTQWVGWVGSYHFGGQSGIYKLDAWGDGFYFSTAVNPKTVNPAAQWGAQRWVRSGTFICGRAFYTNGLSDTACIAVRV